MDAAYISATFRIESPAPAEINNVRIDYSIISVSFADCLESISIGLVCLYFAPLVAQVINVQCFCLHKQNNILTHTVCMVHALTAHAFVSLVRLFSVLADGFLFGSEYLVEVAVAPFAH